MINKTPLNLPKGSVRSIIALFIVIVGVCSMIYMYILSMKTKTPVPDAFVAFMSAIIGSVITYYYTMRGKESNQPSSIDSNVEKDDDDCCDDGPIINNLNQ